MTFYDPDHSDDEERFITLGIAANGKVLFVSHTDRETVTRIISAQEATKKSVMDMKKPIYELRAEYDLSQLKGCVRGKYAARAKQGTNIILLAPDVAEVFQDDASVNEALRTLIRLNNQQSQRMAAA